MTTRRRAATTAPKTRRTARRNPRLDLTTLALIGGAGWFFTVGPGKDLFDKAGAAAGAAGGALTGGGSSSGSGSSGGAYERKTKLRDTRGNPVVWTDRGLANPQTNAPYRRGQDVFTSSDGSNWLYAEDGLNLVSQDPGSYKGGVTPITYFLA